MASSSKSVRGSQWMKTEVCFHSPLTTRELILWSAGKIVDKENPPTNLQPHRPLDDTRVRIGLFTGRNGRLLQALTRRNPKPNRSQILSILFLDTL